MTVRAHVEYDPQMSGVRVAVSTPLDEDTSVVRLWDQMPQRTRMTYDQIRALPADGTDMWLRLHEDEARAMYEALGAYFGGAGHDTRALRRDYDDERKRVDTLINHLIADGKGKA